MSINPESSDFSLPDLEQSALFTERFAALFTRTDPIDDPDIRLRSYDGNQILEYVQRTTADNGQISDRYVHYTLGATGSLTRMEWIEVVRPSYEEAQRRQERFGRYIQGIMQQHNIGEVEATMRALRQVRDWACSLDTAAGVVAEAAAIGTIEQEMGLRDVNPDELQALLDRAQGITPPEQTQSRV